MQESSFNRKLDSFFQREKLFTYKKRSLILQPNDFPSSVFYINNGYIRVYCISEEGEELTLTILKPKDFFPLTYGMNNAANSFYLEAITPLDLWKTPKEHFLQFVQSNPDVLYELTSQIMVRFDGVLTRMEYLVFSNASIKVAATLIACAKRFGESRDNSVIIQVPLTHRDIATLVGITRETTSLEMKKLENEGCIGKDNRLIVINDMKKLEQKLQFVPQEHSPLSYTL